MLLGSVALRRSICPSVNWRNSSPSSVSTGLRSTSRKALPRMSSSRPWGVGILLMIQEFECKDTNSRANHQIKSEKRRNVETGSGVGWRQIDKIRYIMILKLIIVSLIPLSTFPATNSYQPDSRFPRFPVSLTSITVTYQGTEGSYHGIMSRYFAILIFARRGAQLFPY